MCQSTGGSATGNRSSSWRSRDSRSTSWSLSGSDACQPYPFVISSWDWRSSLRPRSTSGGAGLRLNGHIQPGFYPGPRSPASTQRGYIARRVRGRPAPRAVWRRRERLWQRSKAYTGGKQTDSSSALTTPGHRAGRATGGRPWPSSRYRSAHSSSNQPHRDPLRVARTNRQRGAAREHARRRPTRRETQPGRREQELARRTQPRRSAPNRGRACRRRPLGTRRTPKRAGQTARAAQTARSTHAAGARPRALQEPT